MVDKIIAWSARNKFTVILLTLAALAGAIVTLAEAEGLSAHAETVRIRELEKIV